jgi:hypothetical protein
MTTFRPSVLIPYLVNGVTQYKLGDLPTGDQLAQDALPSSATVIQVAYDNRNTLRSGTNKSGNLALVEAIGLFRFYEGSTEPDDDETCFVQSTVGAWQLECPHWDFIDANQLLDETTQDERIEDAETNITALQAFQAKFLTNTVSNTITTLAAVTQTTLTVTVTGAAVGNAVIITPDANLDARISLFARVSAANTVTVTINNPSASAATLTTGTWRVTVIKP